jgi:hypothetical protein
MVTPYAVDGEGGKSFAQFVIELIRAERTEGDPRRNPIRFNDQAEPLQFDHVHSIVYSWDGLKLSEINEM